MDEHAAIADLVVIEQAAEDRVVPGLGQLIVEAAVDQADIGELDQRPAFDVLQVTVDETLLQRLDHLADLLLVEVDPLSRGLLDFLPLRLLEAAPATIGDLAEMLTVIIEAIEYRLGDSGRLLLDHETASAVRAKARA